MTYDDFIASKQIQTLDHGLSQSQIKPINKMLYPFQRDIVAWAIKKGRAAIFADCGMGKTAIQLQWAAQVPGRVIVVAPLAVGQQTVREGEKFGVQCEYSRTDSGAQIVVTNYEMLDKFNPGDFTGIVLDESSILKSHSGKFRNYLIREWGGLDYRLAATATPAPNDHMELGNHSEFLGAMTRMEMLSMFFVHDGGDTQKWRLKGHARSEFWKWVCSWAVMIRKPSDLGYNDDKFDLPECNVHECIVESAAESSEFLFRLPALTLSERLNARRDTIQERCSAAVEIIGSRPNEPWLVWCNLNTESQTITRMIPDAVEVAGSNTIDQKESRMNGFSGGAHRVLVTKPSIAGHGMNWQHCHNMVFVGLSDSWEQYYQAVRRCWRFGQIQPVHTWIVISDLEGAVLQNIRRKEDESAVMADSMLRHMHAMNKANINGESTHDKRYYPCEIPTIPAFLSSANNRARTGQHTLGTVAR